MPRGKKATQQAQANPNPNPNPQGTTQQAQPNPQPQPQQAPVNNNTNTNSNGGTTMNGQANNNNNNNGQNANTQTTVNGGNNMNDTMNQMMQVMMVNMMQNMQNQNQNPTNQLMQLLVTKELQNINNGNNTPKSALGQTLEDMQTFTNMITPSEDALTRAEDAAEAKAREKFNTAYAAYQTALPNLGDAEIRALLKVANVEEPTQTQIELERKKAREEAIQKKQETFNEAQKGFYAFQSVMNGALPTPPAPSAATTATAPTTATSPKRNFGEAFCDVLASPSYGRIAVINAWKGIK